MRTIIIGDVHGCAWELATLIDRLGPTDHDRLYMVGDLVVRGPEPLRALSLVREIGALAVRGNHEDRLLRWRAARAAMANPRGTELPHSEARLLKAKWLVKTAEEIDEEGWALIESLPLWRDVPTQDLRIVHGGVLPGVPIDQQTDHTLLNIRTIDPGGQPSDLRDGGRLWGASYSGPPHIVFGHNAQPEPQFHPSATGIDTGCVYGGSLTALVLPDHQPIPPASERRDILVSVKARRDHYPIS